jgi:hypothetical protein
MACDSGPRALLSPEVRALRAIAHELRQLAIREGRRVRLRAGDKARAA